MALCVVLSQGVPISLIVMGAVELGGFGFRTSLYDGPRAQTTLERWHQVHDLLDQGVGGLECAPVCNWH